MLLINGRRLIPYLQGVYRAMDAFIGEIRIFGGAYVPKGWAVCNGELLTISQYPALFTVLGGYDDGRSHFALPDPGRRWPGAGLAGAFLSFREQCRGRWSSFPGGQFYYLLARRISGAVKGA